ncbi:nascent polypeptide-associated complex subunit alpha, muscle-specific form-like [Dromiciops gliroides]|uniref:nascent polypeptide-associated complex subunit alpha, muscle-specific form-like n=1 Tax=Dromiciops gliroides TaxID=33562 RepID=UPI001CC5EF92|nr:nascent polypeptide-associated complex subunit alpha, muscle-specific form-like [Dromiciops gliroides]
MRSSNLYLQTFGDEELTPSPEASPGPRQWQVRLSVTGGAVHSPAAQGTDARQASKGCASGRPKIDPLLAIGKGESDPPVLISPGGRAPKNKNTPKKRTRHRSESLGLGNKAPTRPSSLEVPLPSYPATLPPPTSVKSRHPPPPPRPTVAGFPAAFSTRRASSPQTHCSAPRQEPERHLRFPRESARSPPRPPPTPRRGPPTPGDQEGRAPHLPHHRRRRASHAGPAGIAVPSRCPGTGRKEPGGEGSPGSARAVRRLQSRGWVGGQGSRGAGRGDGAGHGTGTGAGAGESELLAASAAARPSSRPSSRASGSLSSLAPSARDRWLLRSAASHWLNIPSIPEELGGVVCCACGPIHPRPPPASPALASPLRLTQEFWRPFIHSFIHSLGTGSSYHSSNSVPQ